MSDTIRETADQVAALIPRFSWELMDEDQRDALFDGVIVKRYMKVTKDGVQLGPTWWADALGCTKGTISERWQRRKAADQGKPASALTPKPNEVASIRSAKAAIRKHPELAKKLLDDAKVNDAVTDAVLTGTGRTGTRPDSHREVRREIDLMKLLNDIGYAIERAMRHVPDYLPDADTRDEARDIANECEIAATFLRDWASNKNIADEVSAFLEGK